MNTIQIADKPTLDEILALLENTTYGLNALKNIINSKNVDLTPITSQLSNSTYGLSALNTDIDTVQNTLNNSTYGLSAIKNAVNGRANETTVTAIKTLLENSTYGLSAIKNAASGGCVKSVQRGVATGKTSGDNVSITINTIDPSKSLVILNASITSNSSNSIFTPYVVSLTSTVLTVGGSYDSYSGKEFSWQVIEFY